MEYGYLDKEVKALVAERDRLATENAELRELLEIEQATALDAAELSAAWANAASEANATLDALREAVPEGTKWCTDCDAFTMPATDPEGEFCSECEGDGYWNTGFPYAVYAILHLQPKETTDEE